MMPMMWDFLLDKLRAFRVGNISVFFYDRIDLVSGFLGNAAGFAVDHIGDGHHTDTGQICDIFNVILHTSVLP